MGDIVAFPSANLGPRRLIGGYATGGEDGLVKGFLAGLSRPTAACYGRDLASLRAFLASFDTDLLSAGARELRAYVSFLEGAGEAPATIRRRLAAASSFYRFAVAEGLLERSPLAWVRRPSGRAAPRLGLDQYALRRLWAAAVRYGTQAQLLVGLLALAGLRVSEACALDTGDVSLRGGTMYATVRRKGGRRDVVALIPPLEDLVVEAIAEQGSGPLLRSAKGRRLSRQAAWEAVRRLGEDAGVDVYPHLLRHTHVTLAIEAGVGLLEVAASAGHRDPRTTAAYVEALRAVAAVLSQAGPTASDRADS